MVRENAELGLIANFDDALRRFAELYEQWRATIARIEGAADGADLGDLEREAEQLARELADVGRVGANGLRQLEGAADRSGVEVDELRRQVDRLEDELRHANSRIDDFGKRGRASFGGLKSAIAGLGAAIAAIGLGRAIREVVEATGEQQAATAKLNATLEATGHAAGLTGKQLQEIASGLQRVTTSGDEANLHMLSILLTFKQIGGDILPEVAERVLDVATVMGTDARSAAIQLGKALNDPVRGIDGLNRAGIQFTADQKATIKRLVETGQAAEAQRLILKELEGQVGGVARGLRDSLPGAIAAAKNAIGDLAEQVGEGGLGKELRFAAEATTALATESESGQSAAEGLGSAMGAVVRAAVFVVTQYSRARAIMASFFSTIIGGGADAADAMLGFAQKSISAVKGLIDSVPGAGFFFRGYEEGAEKALGVIGRLREGGIANLKLLAESYEEVAVEQNIVADELADRLEKLRAEMDGTGAAAAAMGEQGEEGAAGLTNLATAAAEALPPVQALAEAASTALDFTAFGPGAEDAAKRAETLEEQAGRLREQIAELEGLPAKSTEQVAALFDATDQLAEVEGELAKALEEAAPIISGGTSLVEDHGETARETTRFVQDLVREQLALGKVTAEQAAAFGVFADEADRLTLATEQAPAAFDGLSTAIDGAGIEVRDLTGAQAQQLAVTGDLNESLAGMKERLDAAGLAQAELGKAAEQSIAEQVEGYEKLTAEHRAQAESITTLRKHLEAEARKSDAALSIIARRWQELNRLCAAHKECLSS